MYEPRIWDIFEHIERPFEWPPKPPLPPRGCPECEYIIVKHGVITDLKLKNGKVSEISMSGGFIYQFDGKGMQMDLEIPNAYKTDSTSSEYRKVLDEISQKSSIWKKVRGLIVRDGKLKGLIFSKSDLEIKTGPIPKVHLFSKFSVGGFPVLEPGNKLSVNGNGFLPSGVGVKTIIRVNGNMIVKGVKVDQYGNFRQFIAIEHEEGPHDIVVEQYRGKKVTRVSEIVLAVPGGKSDSK